MRENSIDDITRNLEITLNNNVFKHNLDDARNNWLELSTDEVITNILNYFKSLEKIEV